MLRPKLAPVNVRETTCGVPDAGTTATGAPVSTHVTLETVRVIPVGIVGDGVGAPVERLTNQDVLERGTPRPIAVAVASPFNKDDDVFAKAHTSATRAIVSRADTITTGTEEAVRGAAAPGAREVALEIEPDIKRVAASAGDKA